MPFHPVRACICFKPVKKVEEDLRAHAVGNQDDFLMRGLESCFNVGLEAGIVLVANFEHATR